MEVEESVCQIGSLEEVESAFPTDLTEVESAALDGETGPHLVGVAVPMTAVSLLLGAPGLPLLEVPLESLERLLRLHQKPELAPLLLVVASVQQHGLIAQGDARVQGNPIQKVLARRYLSRSWLQLSLREPLLLSLQPW